MAQPTVDSATFQSPDPASNDYGGPWALRIVVQGSGFVARGLPLQATVGPVPVLGIFRFPYGAGFAGFLPTLPPDGSVLSVGYEQLLPTTIVYHSDAVA